MMKKALTLISLLWGAGFIIAGIVMGILGYRHISYSIYFLLPFVTFGLVGVIPASLLLLMTYAKTWRGRLAWVVLYVIAITAIVESVAIWKKYYEIPRNGGPYLVFSGDPKTTMTICWAAEKAVPGKIDYVKDGESGWLHAECASAHYPKVLLEGLQPGTHYRYRVPALGNKEHSFQTAPSAPEDFSFAVYGDNRHAGFISFHQSVLRAIKREEPNYNGFRLILNSGDIVERSGTGHGWQWHSFLRDITPLASSRPYEVSLGNHEAGGSPKYYEEFFDYGVPDHWRVLDYAGVRFIALSTQDDLEPGSPQYAWLVKTLDTPPADTRFTVVTLHKPLLTYDPRERYHDPALRSLLEPLFPEKKVDIVFAGHVHAYEHHHLPAFEHVITGGGGVMLWNKPVPGPETVKTETCWHFCAVEVKGNTMSVRAIRTDCSLLDAFTITSKKI
ncbi:MAG TPA: metallophosphoesterase family protein [Candidatus Hydrogenedentes bacterium]|nr:metallophosphoesterase family protein [Candidatus Hydrogenedentota bacterium]